MDFSRFYSQIIQIPRGFLWFSDFPFNTGILFLWWSIELLNLYWDCVFLFSGPFWTEQRCRRSWDSTSHKVKHWLIEYLGSPAALFADLLSNKLELMVVILSCAIPKWAGDFDHLKTLLMCSHSCDFHFFWFCRTLKTSALWNGSCAKSTDAQTQWSLRSAVIEMAFVDLYRAGAVPLPVLLRPDAILNASKPGWTAGKLKNFGGRVVSLVIGVMVLTH